MSSGERKRSLTSEIADVTIKKNGFEERRLQRKLQALDELSVRQQKRRSEEQLEYALCNLSLENMDTFNGLTRKLLRSNFLPPIDRKAREGTSDREKRGGNDLLVERLRGSKMIKKYLEGKGPRKLTRSLSADSGKILRSGEPNHAAEQTENKAGPYSAFVKMRPHRQKVSFVEVETRGGSEKQIAGTFSKDKATARRVKSNSESSSSKHQTPVAGQDFVGDERKIQHHCVADAIEYKLKMRELSRKT